jgi:hypothetical protein
MKNQDLKSADKTANGKVDWTALIQLIGILIKFLFKVMRDKKKDSRK